MGTIKNSKGGVKKKKDGSQKVELSPSFFLFIFATGLCVQDGDSFLFFLGKSTTPGKKRNNASEFDANKISIEGKWPSKHTKDTNENWQLK